MHGRSTPYSGGHWPTSDQHAVHLEPVKVVESQALAGGVTQHKSPGIVLRSVGYPAHTGEKKRVRRRETLCVQVGLHLHLEISFVQYPLLVIRG